MSGNNHTDITDAQRAARQKNAAKAAEGRKKAVTDRRAAAAAELADAGVPSYQMSEARLMAAKAQLAELELAERRGELVPIDEARADVMTKFTLVKTRILGVPARVAQRLPGLAAEVVPVIDELLREALEELALDGDDT